MRLGKQAGRQANPPATARAEEMAEGAETEGARPPWLEGSAPSSLITAPLSSTMRRSGSYPARRSMAWHWHKLMHGLTETISIHFLEKNPPAVRRSRLADTREGQEMRSTTFTIELIAE